MLHGPPPDLSDGRGGYIVYNVRSHGCTCMRKISYEMPGWMDERKKERDYIYSGRVLEIAFDKSNGRNS